MTTIDLLQCYPSHRDSTHHDEASHETTAFDSNKPDLMPNFNPSQYFDAKTKLLHDMLDRTVKDLANSQSEPVSEWEGTLWRSPLRPRSPSPAYSEISESFESPCRIEHCTNELLSTPLSPTSTHSRGPDGWPLGIEVAMNDFHRGRLSTPILEERDLPNRLVLRKRRQQTPHFRGSDSRKGQETLSCNSLSFEQQFGIQRQQESVGLRPLALQMTQSRVLSQQSGERHSDVDSAKLEPRHYQQQGFKRPQQKNDCRYGDESVDVHLPEVQEQHDGRTSSDMFCTSTLSARKYGDDQSSLTKASMDLYPAANGSLPIGLALENAVLEHSIFQPYCGQRDESHTPINTTRLLPYHNRQRALSNTLPGDKEIHANVHNTELQIDALADALNEKTHSSKALSAVDIGVVKSLNRDFCRLNTFNDSRNDTLQATESPTSDDSETNTDSDIVSWKTSGLLRDIVEESEDLHTNKLALYQDQPQHFTLASVKPLDLPKSSGAGKRRDSMLAIQGTQTKTSTLSLSPPRVPPALKLTINPSSKLPLNSNKASGHRPSDAKVSHSTLSATTMVRLKGSTRKEGRLSPTTLAELRKTAESQPHFQTKPASPEDQSQARIHPLLRSKSLCAPSPQPSKVANDSALKYVFEDDDSESHEIEAEDSVSCQITTESRSSFEPEAQIAKGVITHTFLKEHTSSQVGKVLEQTIPRYLRKEDDIEGQEAEYEGSFTPQSSSLRSSNDATLLSSPENITPSSGFLPATSLSTMNGLPPSVAGSLDVIPSSILQSSTLSATTSYCLNSTTGSLAAYNSWASTSHHHQHANTCSTPSSGATALTSTVPTANATLCTNSPTSCGLSITPASSFGQLTGGLATSGGTKMSPSSPFGQSTEKSPAFGGNPVTPSSSLGDFTGNKNYRRSVSFSSMFARYHKARYPDLPTAAMTDSIQSSKVSAEWNQAKEATNDPFTSTHDNSTSFSMKMKAPSKEDLPDTSTRCVDRFDTPTKRNSGRFSLHRRSLSVSGRPRTNEGIERALSSLIFNPHRSRLQKRSDCASRPNHTTAKPASGSSAHRRSLSIDTNNANQKWEIAPLPTPLCLRDEFSLRYRPEPLEAHDNYATRKDALQGVKQGLRKVFGRS